MVFFSVVFSISNPFCVVFMSVGLVKFIIIQVSGVTWFVKVGRFGMLVPYQL